MKVCFVPAVESDASAIATLRREVWSTTYRGIYPDEAIDNYDFQSHLEKDRARIADPAFQVYLIKDGETPIGYLNLQERDGLYIQALYILQEYQGRGVGKSAFALVRRYCRQHGLSRFTCNCNAHNLPAQGFYTAMGGEIIARNEGHENRRDDQVTFEFFIN